MKRKIISCILLIIFCVALIVSLFSVNKNTIEYKLNNKNDISVMVYDEDEDGYVKHSSIPTGDYILNDELSYCEAKGQIGSYDSILGTVTTNLKGPDKCYYYFDLATRQIALVPKPMTSNINSDGGVASAYIGNVQSGNIKTTAYVVFDDDLTNNIDDGWGGDGNINNSQITYEFPARVVVNKVMIANLNGGSGGRYYLYSVKVQRSNDGTNWTDVHTISNMGSNTANTEYYYEFENTTAAKYWRIKGVSSLNNYKWLIQELQFYGYYEVNNSNGTYAYKGYEETYIVPTTGIYKIEAWGASGGNTYRVNDPTDQAHTGGYGAYAVGEIELTSGTTLYINVGGEGSINTGLTGGSGGYNGGGTGGNGTTQSYYGINGPGGGGGGGASSVALSSGSLYDLGQASNQSNVIIVAAGGGGASGSGNQSGLGNAGGISSNSVSSNGTCGSVSLTGATQSTGYAFGLGGNGRNATCAQVCNDCEGTGGGGGGYYGGNAYTGTGRSSTVSGTGGSSYIGYSTLSNKKMLCYTGCTTDTNTATKTETTSCTDSTATSDCLKTGNGAVKITLIDENVLQSAPRSSLTLTTQCATEHGTCTFSGTKTVYYCGTSTCYYKKFIDSVLCENSIFGDPQSGATKYCYI